MSPDFIFCPRCNEGISLASTKAKIAAGHGGTPIVFCPGCVFPGIMLNGVLCFIDKGVWEELERTGYTTRFYESREKAAYLAGCWG